MRNAKIDELDEIVAIFVMHQKHVIRLDIAVNDTLGMGAAQGTEQLAHDQTGRHRIQRAQALDAIRKRFT